MITRQQRCYKRHDKPVKHQPAIPPEVFRQLLRLAQTPRERTRAYLLAAAVFFCLRSCEYTKTPKHEEQKTHPICPTDITFRKNGEELSHDHPRLHLADTITITFRLQKAEYYYESVTQYRTEDPELCPIRCWAAVLRRLRSEPKYDPTKPVYTYHDASGKQADILSKEIMTDIKRVVSIIGKNILGFTANEVGTHSVRAGGAMMMYLAKTPVYTIMMIGRWHSNAFLRYIEKQVLEFSKGVANKMLTYNTFFNIPVRPWTDTTEIEHSRSANHYLPQALSQTFGFGRVSA